MIRIALAMFALMFGALGTNVMAQQLAYQGIKQDVVIDVRTPLEFMMGHIPGAINVPLSDIERDIATVQGINKNSRILLYCRSGNRSETARLQLEKLGYRAVQNGGGMDALKSKLSTCVQQAC